MATKQAIIQLSFDKLQVECDNSKAQKTTIVEVSCVPVVKKIGARKKLGFLICKNRAMFFTLAEKWQNLINSRNQKFFWK